MKTTLDLDDELLIGAKTLAASRRTTLKALVEQALRREIQPASETENPDPEKYELGPFGILRLKRRSDHTVTAERIQGIQDEMDAEELRRAVGHREP